MAQAGGILNSQLNPNDVKTAIDAVVYAEWELEAQPSYAAATDSKVFKQYTTDRQSVIQELYRGVGYWSATGEEEEAPAASAGIGNPKISRVLNYRKRQIISKNLFDDDQHAVVNETMKDFGSKARITKDSVAMGIFNNGFTTQLTADDASLFSDTHTTLSGETVDNKGTAALSPSSLSDAINALMTQKMQDGTIGVFMPSVLLVPPALFKLATEIVGSAYLANTANNNENYLVTKYGNLEVKQSPFLAAAAGLGGSDTAWFLLSDRHQIMRWTRQDLVTSLRNWDMSDNFDYVYMGEYREVYDTISYEGTFGSTGLS